MPRPYERKRLARIARRQEDRQEQQESDLQAPYRHIKKIKKFYLEYRLRPELQETYDWLFKIDKEWKAWFHKYNTEKDRDQALEILNKKERLWEFRIPL